jgi:glucose/arabinose dehydrogenase
MFFGRASLALAFALFAAFAFSAQAQDGVQANLAKIKMPPGFKIAIYAEVPGARAMAVGKPMGVVFVGTRHDSVFAVVDRDKDRTADQVLQVMTGMHVPNGIAFNAGFLYVAEQTRIGMYAAPEFDIYQQFRVATIHEGLPDEFLHGWRTLAIGPDKKLYVAVGSPCNICEVSDPAGTIMRMNLDGSDPEIYARGVRNSVGMDFHPKTGELFFTDNGGDGLGDEVPADELNHAPKMGLDFGFPHHAGGQTVSPGFEDKKPDGEITLPVIEFGAHHAALGIHFYKGAMFPAEYKGDAFVAQHGSWNRTDPAGYRIMRIRFDGAGKPVGKEVFAEGWLQGDEAWGRPVAFATLGDGSLLVSDDYAGIIYRISYGG